MDGMACRISYDRSQGSGGYLNDSESFCSRSLLPFQVGEQGIVASLSTTCNLFGKFIVNDVQGADHKGTCLPSTPSQAVDTIQPYHNLSADEYVI